MHGIYEGRTTLELQHINIKLPLKNRENIELAELIPVFHKWIQEQALPEVLLDVADYSHVPDGPGVVLIGHEADYSVDNTDGRLGVRYNRKAAISGSNRERLQQALRSALLAVERLEKDTAGKVVITGQQIEVWINDRLLAPNNQETRSSIEPELTAFFDEILGAGSYSLRFDTNPRKLLGAKIDTEFSPTDLAAKLAQV